MSGIKGGHCSQTQCQDTCKDPCQKSAVCLDPCQGPCKHQHQPNGPHHHGHHVHHHGHHVHHQGHHKQDPCNPCCPDPCQSQGYFCCDK